jgi:hypothetical protein
VELFLSNQVLIFLFSESILFLLGIIAFAGSIKILKNWDFNSTSTKQYKLEKSAYLIVLIILFTLIFKIFLMPYFTYTIDKLSNIVPGAMCAAGVIGANEYGNPLLLVKIILLFLVGIWMIVNKEDIKEPNYPYFREKFWFFVVIFALMSIEFFLDISYFLNISLKQPVSCCSVIFGLSGDNKLPFGLTVTLLLVLFYLLYGLNMMLSLQKNSLLLALFSLLFLYIAYSSVNHFFGTYIYQLPTHICPFCMLQSDYYFVGYLLWTLLFLGVFFGISNAVLKLLIKKEIDSLYGYSRIFNTLFVILCSAYPIVYYIKNGVWL